MRNSLPSRRRKSASSRLVALVVFVAPSCIAGANGPLGRNDADANPAPRNAVVWAHEILNRWEPVAVEAGAHYPAWREVFAAQLTAMDASILRRIEQIRLREPADARARYAQFTQAVRSAGAESHRLASSGKGPTKLGSTTTDQVYIPIVPCRIVDTRNVGGPLSAGETRNYFFYTTDGVLFSWSSQGGTPGPAGGRFGACPGTINPNGGAPSAAVVTVTVVSPSAAGNWILWGGGAPAPTISALNWNAGDIKANTTVIPWGGRAGTGPGGNVLDFAVAYNGPSGSADFVADVVGYLAENLATALECYETPLASKIAGSSYEHLDAPACAPGWTLVGGNCDRASQTTTMVAEYYGGAFPQAFWHCAFVYPVGTMYASSRCCRVPGR